ncbi:MAG: response regulator [Verrucomicrobiota bacterium]|nr:response regulator [Verrucomicrobiota bacterium]
MTFLEECIETKDRMTDKATVARNLWSSDLPHGTAGILLVEDDPAICRLLKRVLEALGYNVTIAHNADHALELWKSIQPSLLIADIVLPGGTTGIQLAEKLKHFNPDLEVLFTTGYSMDTLSPRFQLPSGSTLLQKPYSPVTLAKAVHKSLNGLTNQMPGEAGGG